MQNHIYAIVMAGGSGERFWPMSTSERPKQFVTLFGGKALLRHAIDRLAGLVPPERTLVVTARSLEEATAAACPGLPRENIVGEPCRRDTAAAAALACGLVAAHDPQGVAILLAADHLIGDEALFRATLADAAKVAASSHCIVTMGIRPEFPSTAYGYIEAAETLDAGTRTIFRKAKRFVEKPDRATAERYLEHGGFFWNSGMFVWSAATMAAAIREFAPPLAPLLDAPAKAGSPSALAASLDAIYPDLPKISVDYAIMERHRDVVMASGDFGWDDVGSWPAAAAHLPQDASGNAVVGDVTALDSKGNIVVADAGRPVAILGVEGLVVVQTKDATLVCRKDRSQDIKKLLAMRQQAGRRE